MFDQCMARHFRKGARERGTAVPALYTCILELFESIDVSL